MRVAYLNGQVIDGRGNVFQGYVIIDGERIAERRCSRPESAGCIRYGCSGGLALRAKRTAYA
jgi:hypothetical protein